MILRNFLYSLTLALCCSFCGSTMAQTQEDLEALAYHGRIYGELIRTGRVDEAVAAAERFATMIESRFPKRDHFKGSVLLAEAYGYQARYKEAIEKHQRSMEQLKDYAPQTEADRQLYVIVYGDALRTIGACYDRLGEPKKSLEYYERSTEWWSQARHPEARIQYARGKSSQADAHQVLGNLDKAALSVAEAIAILEPLARAETTIGPATQNLCMALHISGEIDRQLNRFDTAEVKLLRAFKLRVAINGWHHLDTAMVLDNLARLYGSQGRWQEAEAYCRKQLEAYQQSVGPDHLETTNVRVRMANVLNALNRHEEAEALVRPAVTQLAAALGEDNPRTAFARIELAKTLSSQKKYDEAEPLLKQNLEIGRKLYGPAYSGLVPELHLLAPLKMYQGDLAEALRLLDQMAEIHQVNPLSPQSLWGMFGTRAVVLWKSGRREEALAAHAKCLEQVERVQAFAAGAERERAEMFLSVSATYGVAIKWQAELKNVEKLFTAIERAKARTFLDELKLKNADLLAGLSEAERAELKLTEYQLRQELLAAENRFHALPALGPKPAAESLAQWKELSAEVMVARDDLYQHLADMRSESPIYRELIVNKTAAATVPQVQQLLGDDELLLSYAIGDNESFVISARRGSAEFAELSLDEVTAMKLGVAAGPLTIGKLNHILQDPKSGLLTIISTQERRNENPTDRLAALWPALIPPAEREAITSGKLKLLTVLPDGPLALLPFETLVVTNDQDEPHYLLDVGPPIAYAPSASVLLNLAGRKPNDATEQKLLTLGNPLYAASPATIDAVDRKLGVNRAIDRFRSTLTPLPFTGKEANWVQQNLEKVGFTTVKVLGPAATEAAIRQHAPGRQIIHLACHGMADQSYGNFFGALAIAPGRAGDPRDDGYLSMSEIYDLNLDGCELAILSACETNYGPQQEGEGVWALSRGFLVAGSKRVVASNWVVDDQAGATLVSYFASYLTLSGKDPSARNYASALHNAKKHVRKDERWKHPYFWGSLVLVGPK